MIIIKKLFKGYTKQQIQFFFYVCAAYVILSLFGIPFLCNYPVDYTNLLHMYAFILSMAAQIIFGVFIVFIIMLRFINWFANKLYDGITK